MHVYPGPASNVVNMQPRTQLSSAIFIPDEMRNDILARNEIANIVDSIANPGKMHSNQYVMNVWWISIPPKTNTPALDDYVCWNRTTLTNDDILISDIPSEIDNYHSLYLLETLAIHQKLPLPSSTYKATHVSTGIKYCLRRLHGTRNWSRRKF